MNTGTTVSPVFISEYYLKDHLGNTRVSFLGKTLPGNAIEITGKTDYYPFGLAMSQYSTNIGSDYSKNKYLYNGKEIQDDKLNGTFFGWLDYGNRFYDPQLGRFHTIDRKAQKYPYQSPYLYAGNNPVLYIDVNGDFKYPSGANYSQYTVLTSYLKSGIGEIQGSKTIMAGLSKYGQVSASTVGKDVTFGKGPTIEIVDKLPFGANGYYPGNGTIQISKSIVDQLQNASDEEKQAALLVVVSTILHEYVHEADDRDGSDYVEFDEEGNAVVDEEGREFEKDVYGTDISNAEDAQGVIDEKSKTEEGQGVLPTVPATTQDDEKN